jgi:hypothetical protein
MEYLKEHREAIGWILLWAWIAVTLFLMTYKGRKSAKIYLIDLILLLGFAFFMFFWQ